MPVHNWNDIAMFKISTKSVGRGGYFTKPTKNMGDVWLNMVEPTERLI